MRGHKHGLVTALRRQRLASTTACLVTEGLHQDNHATHPLMLAPLEAAGCTASHLFSACRSSPSQRGPSQTWQAPGWHSRGTLQIWPLSEAVLWRGLCRSCPSAATMRQIERSVRTCDSCFQIAWACCDPTCLLGPDVFVCTHQDEWGILLDPAASIEASCLYVWLRNSRPGHTAHTTCSSRGRTIDNSNKALKVASVQGEPVTMGQTADSSHTRIGGSNTTGQVRPTQPQV